MKIHFSNLILIFLSFQFFGISQNNIAFIDSIANEVCNKLQYNDHIKTVKHHDFKLILGLTILEYESEWDSLNCKIMKDEKFSISYLDYLLHHRLLQICPRFLEIDNNYQVKVFSEDRFKNLYITCKKFVVETERGTDPKDLLHFFSSELNKPELTESINHLQKELLKHKKESVLFFNNSGDQLYFYASILHYETGEDLAAIIFSFKNTDDALIDEWEFRSKEELYQPAEDIIIDEEMIRITKDEFQRSEQDTLMK